MPWSTKRSAGLEQTYHSELESKRARLWSPEEAKASQEAQRDLAAREWRKRPQDISESSNQKRLCVEAALGSGQTLGEYEKMNGYLHQLHHELLARRDLHQVFHVMR
eukprot:TRINITY_DN31579_c0_g1_i1.p1 TRINITY_DN31579_c0_g1~~TRINITY_DN31579_c0_g1_i1.p1  ORF type:complete len:118 (-),score=25.06 TRINITY_DN31579_c0_g1_i1:67-387(-)